MDFMLFRFGPCSRSLDTVCWPVHSASEFLVGLDGDDGMMDTDLWQPPLTH